MGMLDGVLESVVSSALKGGQGPGGQNPLANVLGSLVAGAGKSAQGQPAGQGLDTAKLLAAGFALLQQNGGVSGLVENLNRNGLADQVSSWVGTGANKGISPDQLLKALGDPALGKIASQLGVSPQQASASMSQILPELINQLTPKGSVPDNHGDLIAQGLSMLLAKR